MPSQTFLGATASIRDRSWKTTSWKVIAWSLRQLGLAGTASEHHLLHESHVVLLENLEVRCVYSLAKVYLIRPDSVSKPKGKECLIFPGGSSRASSAHEDIRIRGKFGPRVQDWNFAIRSQGPSCVHV